MSFLYASVGRKHNWLPALSIFHVSAICFNTYPRFRGENILVEEGKTVELKKKIHTKTHHLCLIQRKVNFMEGIHNRKYVSKFKDCSSPNSF